jgi:hypothetical protein
MKKLGYLLALAVVAVFCINMGTGGETARSVRGEEGQDIHLKNGERKVFARIEDEGKVKHATEVSLHDPGNKDCWVDGVPFGIEKFKFFEFGPSDSEGSLKLGNIVSIEVLEDAGRREFSDPKRGLTGKFAIIRVTRKDPDTGTDLVEKFYIHSDVKVSYRVPGILYKVLLIELDRIVVEKVEGTK